MDHPDSMPSPPPEKTEVLAGTEMVVVPEAAVDLEAIPHSDAGEVSVEVLPPPPPHYELQRLQLSDKDNFTHLSLAEISKSFRLHKFQISFVDSPDVLTESLIQRFPYDENNLLISVGQLAAGLLLPLYSRKGPFYYDVLSNRDDQTNKTQVRRVEQYNSNYWRALRESW